MTKDQKQSFAGSLVVFGIIIVSLALGAWHWWVGAAFFGCCLVVLGFLIAVFGGDDD